MESSGVKWVRLGDYIEQFRQKCANNKAIVSGVDINKRFIPTRANLDGTDISGYYLVPPTFFACNLMHIGRDERIPIAYNDTDKDLVVTSAYYVFHIKQDKCDEILNEYLYIIFSNKEIDRLTWFYTDSSIRGNLKENRFLDIKIPLPSVAEQQKVVNAWRAFREIREQNEAKAAPQAKYNALQLKGVTSDGVFDVTKAKVQDLDFSNYKVVKKNDFAYNPSRINIGSIALSTADVCIISPMYIVFHVSEDIIIPEYLALWFRRTEFQRSTLFFASGSVRDTFGYKEMCNVKIPLPPIEVQQAIVNIYKCANEAKQIAEEADWLSREVCPALLQHVIHS